MEMKMYRFKDGTLISKRRMDNAIVLVAKLADGFEIINEVDYSEVSEVEAILCYREKHDCSLVEARDAVRFLREE